MFPTDFSCIYRKKVPENGKIQWSFFHYIAEKSPLFSCPDGTGHFHAVTCYCTNPSKIVGNAFEKLSCGKVVTR